MTQRRALGSFARTALAATLAASSLVGCKALTGTSDLQDSSAYSTIMTGTINGGQVRVSSSLASASDTQLIAQVKKQLTYSVGMLNEFSHGTDLSRANITITSKQQLGGTLLLTYNATLVVAWANQTGTPPTSGFRLLLPASVADSSFYNTFGNVCVQAGAAHQSEPNYWYYYRTMPEDCRTAMARNPSLVVTETMYLSPSALMTTDRAPEYDLIWQNGRFTATFLFGRNESGPSSNDLGIQIFNSMAAYMTQLSGSSGSHTQDNVDGVFGDSQIQWTWNVNGKPFDVMIWLVPGDLDQLDSNFTTAYRQRAAVSNLLVYNGHSGLGENLQQLVNLGWFRGSGYQLMTINACDSYNYDYSSLKRASDSSHGGSTRYFDLITNASPADFNAFLKGSQAILTPFVQNAQSGSKPLYTSILAGFDESQHAVVRYEDDNPSAILTTPPPG